MRKKLIAFAAAAVLALAALAGCSSNSSGSSATTASSDSSQGQLEDSLVIYSTHPEALLQEVADDFEAETGVHVEFVNLKGELGDRVRSEIGNPQADIMYGGDSALYTQLADADAFMATTPSWADQEDSTMKDAQGRWYATIKTPVCMFYNTNLMSDADAPTDWTDLTDPKYAGQIVMRDYLSSSQRSAVSNWTYYFQNNGFEGKTGADASTAFLAALDANTKNYYNSSSMLFQAVGTGEAAIGISTFNDINDNIAKNGMPLKAVNAKSGNVVTIDAIAALNGCAHPNAAKAFVEFAGSPEEEAKIANDLNRIPALQSALDNAPAWMQTPMSTLPADWAKIAENQASWLDTWQNTIYTNDKTVAKN